MSSHWARADALQQRFHHGVFLPRASPERYKIHVFEDILHVLRRALLLFGKVDLSVPGVFLLNPQQLAFVYFCPAQLGIAERAPHEAVGEHHQHGAALGYAFLHAFGGQVLRLHIVPDAQPLRLQHLEQLPGLVLPGRLRVGDEDVVQPILRRQDVVQPAFHRLVLCEWEVRCGAVVPGRAVVTARRVATTYTIRSVREPGMNLVRTFLANEICDDHLGPEFESWFAHLSALVTAR
eukprot:SAG31_NODE_199_length_20573_cov_5.832129_16_plen_236_part_00